MNAETLVQFRRQYLCESFQVLLLGGAMCHDDGGIPHGWKDVHTLPLHRLRNGEVHAAGRSDFSLLGHPSVDAKKRNDENEGAFQSLASGSAMPVWMSDSGRSDFRAVLGRTIITS